MEFFSEILPILLYIAGFVLLIVLIIIGVKVIQLLNRVDRIVDNVEGKVNSFNHAMTVFSKAVDGVAGITDSILFGVSSAISKIFNKKTKEEDIYES